MFNVKNPSSLNKPWMLSIEGNDNPISIPAEVTNFLKNFDIIAIEFLYRNYRKGLKGSILNEECDMNVPLQLSAFFRAIVGGPALILVICSRLRSCFWHYHLSNHANLEIIYVTTENVGESYKGNKKKVALIVYSDCLRLCEGFPELDFFSVIIEDIDQIALKRVVKRLVGGYNIGITSRSFYMNPDPKLQWNILNWANPGCVGKIHEFYETINKNMDCFVDNYRFWWLRLTWQFCQSFQKPTEEELNNYEDAVSNWASENSLNFSNEKAKNRKRKKKFLSANQLPRMDENPIVTSIIKNFEISPEPILSCSSQVPYTKTQASLPFTQTKPHCSFNDESSVVASFLEDREKPSTSRSESEDFILKLI